jgi:uncharacterized protein YcfJ
MKLNIMILTAMLLASQSAVSGSYSDTAKITSVDKIYRTHTIREPYQDCYIKEYYQADDDGSMANELVGGLFGGLIGNQFGGGDGKDALTVAGALLGASLAHDDELKKSKTGRVVSKEICETKYRTEPIERLSHYRVEYEYDDRSFTYTTKNKPYGSTLKIKVNVSPR